jgi:hypothetical protein
MRSVRSFVSEQCQAAHAVAHEFGLLRHRSFWSSYKPLQNANHLLGVLVSHLWSLLIATGISTRGHAGLLEAEFCMLTPCPVGIELFVRPTDED